MATALSIHVGLNEVDPVHYGGRQTLTGCVNDANDMAQVAREAGIPDPVVLLDAAATLAAVTGAIEHAAADLAPGGLLVLTYSGHGSSVTDLNGDENDGYDETWCLYDCQLLDDCLFELWAKFAEGVRVVVVSDSCHSGTVTKSLAREFLDARGEEVASPDALVAGRDDAMRGLRAAGPGGEPRARYIRGDAARLIEATHRDLYAAMQAGCGRGRQVEIAASILLLSACQDWEAALEHGAGGVFTRSLVSVWNKGRFEGSYLDFHAAIHQRISAVQRPGYGKVGVPLPAFELQKPFTTGPF